MSTEAVEFYQRMKEAERLANNAKTDLSMALLIQKRLRERVTGLEGVITTALRHYQNGEYSESMEVLSRAAETFRRKA